MYNSKQVGTTKKNTLYAGKGKSTSFIPNRSNSIAFVSDRYRVGNELPITLDATNTITKGGTINVNDKFFG